MNDAAIRDLLCIKSLRTPVTQVQKANSGLSRTPVDAAPTA